MTRYEKQNKIGIMTTHEIINFPNHQNDLYTSSVKEEARYY